MIALYIILAIILLVVALLYAKISVVVDYRQSLLIYARFLGIKIPIFPKKEKKRPKKKKQEKPKETEKQSTKEQSVSLPKILLEMKEAVLKLMEKCFGALHFRFLRLHIVIAGNDAAKTAIEYGAVTQGISYLLEVLNQISNVEIAKCSKINIETDFIHEKPHFDGKIALYIRVLPALKVAVDGYKTYLLFQKKKKQQYNKTED